MKHMGKVKIYFPLGDLTTRFLKRVVKFKRSQASGGHSLF